MKFLKSIIFLFAIVTQIIFGFSKIRKYKKIKPDSRKSETSTKKSTLAQPRFAEIVDLPSFNSESFKPVTYEIEKFIVPKIIEKEEADPNFLENKIQAENKHLIFSSDQISYDSDSYQKATILGDNEEKQKDDNKLNLIEKNEETFVDEYQDEPKKNDLNKLIEKNVLKEDDHIIQEALTVEDDTSKQEIPIKNDTKNVTEYYSTFFKNDTYIDILSNKLGEMIKKVLKRIFKNPESMINIINDSDKNFSLNDFSKVYETNEMKNVSKNIYNNSLADQGNDSPILYVGNFIEKNSKNNDIFNIVADYSVKPKIKKEKRNENYVSVKSLSDKDSDCKIKKDTELVKPSIKTDDFIPVRNKVYNPIIIINKENCSNSSEKNETFINFNTTSIKKNNQNSISVNNNSTNIINYNSTKNKPSDYTYSKIQNSFNNITKPINNTNSSIYTNNTKISNLIKDDNNTHSQNFNNTVNTEVSDSIDSSSNNNISSYNSDSSYSTPNFSNTMNSENIVTNPAINIINNTNENITSNSNFVNNTNEYNYLNSSTVINNTHIIDSNIINNITVNNSILNTTRESNSLINKDNSNINNSTSNNTNFNNKNTTVNSNSSESEDISETLKNDTIMEPNIFDDIINNTNKLNTTTEEIIINNTDHNNTESLNINYISNNTKNETISEINLKPNILTYTQSIVISQENLISNGTLSNSTNNSFNQEDKSDIMYNSSTVSIPFNNSNLLHQNIISQIVTNNTDYNETKPVNNFELIKQNQELPNSNQSKINNNGNPSTISKDENKIIKDNQNNIYNDSYISNQIKPSTNQSNSGLVEKHEFNSNPHNFSIILNNSTNIHSAGNTTKITNSTHNITTHTTTTITTKTFFNSTTNTTTKIITNTTSKIVTDPKSNKTSTNLITTNTSLSSSNSPLVLNSTSNINKSTITSTPSSYLSGLSSIYTTIVNAATDVSNSVSNASSSISGELNKPFSIKIRKNLRIDHNNNDIHSHNVTLQLSNNITKIDLKLHNNTETHNKSMIIQISNISNKTDHNKTIKHNITEHNNITGDIEKEKNLTPLSSTIFNYNIKPVKVEKENHLTNLDIPNDSIVNFNTKDLNRISVSNEDDKEKIELNDNKIEAPIEKFLNDEVDIDLSDKLNLIEHKKEIKNLERDIYKPQISKANPKTDIDESSIISDLLKGLA